jgi:hypothetical protein
MPRTAKRKASVVFVKAFDLGRPVQPFDFELAV